MKMMIMMMIMMMIIDNDVPLHRPGGGDRAKALPRPKVEVNSEGSNVIVVKLTFPDNENIQVTSVISLYYIYTI